MFQIMRSTFEHTRYGIRAFGLFRIRVLESYFHGPGRQFVSFNLLLAFVKGAGNALVPNSVAIWLAGGARSKLDFCYWASVFEGFSIGILSDDQNQHMIDFQTDSKERLFQNPYDKKTAVNTRITSLNTVRSCSFGTIQWAPNAQEHCRYLFQELNQKYPLSRRSKYVSSERECNLEVLHVQVLK